MKKLNTDNVPQILVDLLRNSNYKVYTSYGYDIYLPNLLRVYFENQGIGEIEIHNLLKECSPHFYNAAWDLCRRGIIRPGVTHYQAQETGSVGDGYSFTPFGKKWLKEKKGDDFVPTEPSRFAKMLEEFDPIFGPGYQQRTQEAIRSYDAHAYLACCTMCGAAAESALFKTAIKLTHDEDNLIKMYQSNGGRKKIEHIVVGQSRKQLQDEFTQYHTLLKYWRDEAAHGWSSKISEPEAFTALGMLLRFSMFLNNNFK